MQEAKSFPICHSIVFAWVLHTGISKGNASALRQNSWTEKTVWRTQNCPVLPKSFQWANLNWFSNKSFLFPVDAISLITALKKINQTMQLKICSCISEPVISDTFFWIFISITSARIGRPGPPSASHNKEIMFVLKYQMSAYSCTGTNQLFCG